MGFVAPADDLLMQFKVSLNCCVSRPASIRPTRRDWVVVLQQNCAAT